MAATRSEYRQGQFRDMGRRAGSRDRSCALANAPPRPKERGDRCRSHGGLSIETRAHVEAQGPQPNLAAIDRGGIVVADKTGASDRLGAHRTRAVRSSYRVGGSISTVAVIPAISETPSGARSILMRTGI